MERISLNGAWQGKRVGGFAFSARVPGCTIADLLENGYLPKDLLAGKNADAALRVSLCPESTEEDVDAFLAALSAAKKMF